MKKVVLIAVLVVIMVVCALAGIKALQIKKLVAAGQGFAPPPETVASAVVHEEKWQNTLETVGSVIAVQGVNVTTELPGIVREIAFESGAQVNQGDLLVRLDTSLEEAQLRALEAQSELAKIDAARLRTLRAEQMVSESVLDSAEATLKQTQANADALRATIAKKTIRAAFAGQLGLRLVNLGEYVDTGKSIVSLQALRPVYADFSMRQQELAQLEKGMHVRLSTDTYPDRPFVGTLVAINPDLDLTTRTVRLRAAFDNSDLLLRPGMFARIEVLLPSERSALVIPTTAVLSSAYGESVYVIEPKNATNSAGSNLVVRQQFIRTGRARGDFVTVETGLHAGERVVSAGVFKLRNRMAVIENNAVGPATSKEPHPAEG